MCGFANQKTAASGIMLNIESRCACKKIANAKAKRYSFHGRYDLSNIARASRNNISHGNTISGFQILRENMIAHGIEATSVVVASAISLLKTCLQNA
jgi:hypothetical protein